MLRLLAVLVVALLAAGCGGSGSSSAQLDSTSWSLTHLGSTEAQPGGMLAFDNGNLTGSTGCNSFGGTYTQDGAKLSISLGPTTLIGCPPALQEQERTVLAVLPRTATFTSSGDTLTLLDSSGAKLLTYSTLSPAALVGPEWHATGINNGQEAVVSVLAGTTVTATFGADGTVHGSGGCNTYSAGYRLNGELLHVDAPAATRKLCSAPAGVMEQETAFLHALQSSTQVELSPHGVTLRDATGATQVTLAEAGP
jgi:heat shock protein HslJ